MKKMLCILHLALIINCINCQDYVETQDYGSSQKEFSSKSKEVFKLSVQHISNNINKNAATEMDDDFIQNHTEKYAELQNITEYFMLQTAKEDVSTTASTIIDKTVTELIVGDFISRHYRSREMGNSNYPYSVSIQKKGSHHATGALLDSRWILSVAAEFYHAHESLKLFRARMGSVNCKKGGTVLPLKRIEIHPSFVVGKPSFDLALLRLAVPVGYSKNIRPIGLSTNRDEIIGGKFLTSYWPRLIVNGTVLPQLALERHRYNSMRVSMQKLIPWDKCYRFMQATGSLLDWSLLCLKPMVARHSPCSPDAGAPVVAEDGLWGITSGWVSEKCHEVPSPTTFTRISLPVVRSWLNLKLVD